MPIWTSSVSESLFDIQTLWATTPESSPLFTQRWLNDEWEKTQINGRIQVVIDLNVTKI